MAWVKKTDGAPWSKKIAPLSDAAYRLYDQSIHYCAREETDGTVLLSLIPVVIAGIKSKKIKEAIGELTAAKLWHEPGDSCPSPHCPAHLRQTCEGSWDIHDYFEHNRTHAELEVARAELSTLRKEAGRRGGLAKAQANRYQTASKFASELPDAVSSKNVVPSRPVPSRVRSEPPVVPLDAEWVALCKAGEEILGRPCSPLDREAAHRILAENSRLTHDDLLAELVKFQEWWDAQGIDRRAGLKEVETWMRKANASAADRGIRPRSSGAPRGGEMARVLS